MRPPRVAVAKGRDPAFVPEGDPTHCPDCGWELPARLDAHRGGTYCKARVVFNELRTEGYVELPEFLNTWQVKSWALADLLKTARHVGRSRWSRHEFVYFGPRWLAAVLNTLAAYRGMEPVMVKIINSIRNDVDEQAMVSSIWLLSGGKRLGPLFEYLVSHYNIPTDVTGLPVEEINDY